MNEEELRLYFERQAALNAYALNLHPTSIGLDQGILSLEEMLAIQSQQTFNSGASSTSSTNSNPLIPPTKSSGPALSYDEVAVILRRTGFLKSRAVVMLAIAKGESGLKPTAIGDETIQTGKWGPSIGLWQVRTIKAETGKGTDRDITVLYDPDRNAKAAYAISGAGVYLKPWTIWKNGVYKKFMAEARAAIERAYRGR